uniref:Uncharacterized protein n=1 Tax=Leersia perrieri TaxID=77586 RepID=A0A0D9VKN5_9ORYZ
MSSDQWSKRRLKSGNGSLHKPRSSDSERHSVELKSILHVYGCQRFGGLEGQEPRSSQLMSVTGSRRHAYDSPRHVREERPFHFWPRLLILLEAPLQIKTRSNSPQNSQIE